MMGLQRSVLCLKDPHCVSFICVPSAQHRTQHRAGGKGLASIALEQIDRRGIKNRNELMRRQGGRRGKKTNEEKEGRKRGKETGRKDMSVKADRGEMSFRVVS